MLKGSSTDIIEKEDVDISSLFGKPYHTILFDDDHHSMEEVSSQIVKAIHCSSNRASEIMLDAHKNGRAIVITTHKERCEHVASILDEIRLGTKVEPTS